MVSWDVVVKQERWRQMESSMRYRSLLAPICKQPATGSESRTSLAATIHDGSVTLLAGVVER